LNSARAWRKASLKRESVEAAVKRESVEAAVKGESVEAAHQSLGSAQIALEAGALQIELVAAPVGVGFANRGDAEVRQEVLEAPPVFGPKRLNLQQKTEEVGLQQSAEQQHHGPTAS